MQRLIAVLEARDSLCMAARQQLQLQRQQQQLTLRGTLTLQCRTPTASLAGEAPQAAVHSCHQKWNQAASPGACIVQECGMCVTIECAVQAQVWRP